MSKRYDLIVQQFGKLTVTGRDTEAKAEQRLHGEFLDWYYAREIPVIAEFSKKQVHAVPEEYSFEVGI